MSYLKTSPGSPGVEVVPAVLPALQKSEREKPCPWDDCIFPECNTSMGCPDIAQAEGRARIAAADAARQKAEKEEAWSLKWLCFKILFFLRGMVRSGAVRYGRVGRGQNEVPERPDLSGTFPMTKDDARAWTDAGIMPVRRYVELFGERPNKSQERVPVHGFERRQPDGAEWRSLWPSGLP